MIVLSPSSKAFNIKGRGLVVCVNQDEYSQDFSVGTKVSWEGQGYQVRAIEMFGIGEYVNPNVGLVLRKLEEKMLTSLRLNDTYLSCSMVPYPAISRQIWDSFTVQTSCAMPEYPSDPLYQVFHQVESQIIPVGDTVMGGLVREHCN